MLTSEARARTALDIPFLVRDDAPSVEELLDLNRYLIAEHAALLAAVRRLWECESGEFVEAWMDLHARWVKEQGA